MPRQFVRSIIRPQRRMPLELVDRIIALWGDGLSFAKIAADVGKSRGTIAGVLWRRGLRQATRDRARAYTEQRRGAA